MMDEDQVLGDEAVEAEDEDIDEEDGPEEDDAPLIADEEEDAN